MSRKNRKRVSAARARFLAQETPRGPLRQEEASSAVVLKEALQTVADRHPTDSAVAEMLEYINQAAHSRIHVDKALGVISRIEHPVKRKASLVMEPVMWELVVEIAKRGSESLYVTNEGEIPDFDRPSKWARAAFAELFRRIRSGEFQVPIGKHEAAE